MSLGDLLAILGFPPIVGIYYASLVLGVTAATASPNAALREAERAAPSLPPEWLPLRSWRFSLR